MSDNVTGLADPDTTDINLTPNVTGSIGSTWHANISHNHYAWIYVIGGVALLWAMGASFKA